MTGGRPIARSGPGPAAEPARQGEARGWRRIDRSAVGLIYGAIMVLSILMGSGGATFEMAPVLFGSVLAITLAKAFAETVSHALETGERITRGAGHVSTIVGRKLEPASGSALQTGV